MASPVDTSVKFFRDDMPGISGVTDLAGVAGRTSAIFKLCLVDGAVARSVTSITVSSGIATATLPTNALNANLVDSVQLIAGVTGGMTGATGMNGEQKVLPGATTTTFTFPTSASDGTATGTITTRLAPAGFSTAYTGTNKAAFRIVDPLGSSFYLRMDDTGTTTCLVRAYETMSDVDTGSGPFPTTGEASLGVYWAKSSAANSTANKWDMLVDSRTVYWLPAANSGATPTAVGQASYSFGDMIPYRSTDAFCTSLSGATAAPGGQSGQGSIGNYSGSGGLFRFARASTGLGSAIVAFAKPECGAISNQYSGADPFLGSFPPPDGKLRVGRVLVSDSVVFGTPGTIPRGIAPGLAHCPQSDLYLSFQRGDIIVPSDGPLASRRLYCVMSSGNFTDTAASASGIGRLFLDTTGPWR